MSDTQKLNIDQTTDEIKDKSSVDYDKVQGLDLTTNATQEPLPELRPDDYQDDYFPGEEYLAKQNFQQEPLPESRPDDYEDGYLPGEENFAQRKNPVDVAKSKQVAEAQYANSGTAIG
uniref:Uncharacterized protein n=1 Tax=Acrobeloides nanus TaxID=290746 RepID=A0A914DC77_9BILA